MLKILTSRSHRLRTITTVLSLLVSHTYLIIIIGVNRLVNYIIMCNRTAKKKKKKNTSKHEFLL